MAKIVMAGGGLGGLAASIFLARRGHDVTVIERDGPPPGPGTNPDEDAAGWRRPGAPQAQQSHVLLARARRVLLDETPDIHEALLRQGVREHPVVVGLGRLEGEAMLATRRLGGTCDTPDGLYFYNAGYGLRDGYIWRYRFTAPFGEYDRNACRCNQDQWLEKVFSPMIGTLNIYANP